MDFYYIPASPFCRAVEIVAELVGAQLNKKLTDLSKGEHLTEEFLAINPQHCVPTVVDGDLNIWESRVIMGYLVNKCKKGDPLYPEDAKKRARVDHMLYFDFGTLSKAQTDYLSTMYKGDGILDPEKEKKFREALSLLESFVSKSKFVAGDELTIADISITCSLNLSEVCDYDIDNPTVSAYLERVKKALPNYEKITNEPLANFREYIKSRKA